MYKLLKACPYIEKWSPALIPSHNKRLSKSHLYPSNDKSVSIRWKSTIMRLVFKFQSNANNLR